MPFDGTERKLTTRQIHDLETLLEGRRLIMNGWCKKQARYNGRYCVVGATIEAQPRWFHLWRGIHAQLLLARALPIAPH